MTYCGMVLASLVMAAAVFGAERSNREKREAELDAFFASTEVLRLRIEIPPDGIERLKKYEWRFGPQTERESVLATVREGQNVYTNVALHLKGAAGSFRSVMDNPAMTLNFDKHVSRQRFRGLDKLSLNNSVQDPTFVSEQFSRELFLKAGVPVPRATQVLVELNGRDLGLYVLVEGFNKPFLRRHFRNPDGNLYDGGFLKDVTAELSLNSGDDPKDQTDRIALAEAAREPDPVKRLAALEKTLDLDRFLTLVALDVMLWNWDGYAQNRNNWRLFHDRSTGKMVFMPHGLDQLFWKPEGSIFPPMQGLVAKAALGIPEVRTRYAARIKELRGSVFNPQEMTNRVRAIAAKIGPLLQEKYPEVYATHERTVGTFCDAIVRRARSIDEQLAAPMTPLAFGPDGRAPLVKWEPKTEFGRPFLNREPGDNGSEVLQIGTKEGSSIGVWRTRFWLEPGRYRVEGRVKTRDIVPDIGDSRGGAGLRLARSRSDNFVLGTSDWKTIAHEFSVDDPLSEVQILCEFRGASGEASFESVRLSRVAQPK